LSDIPFVQLIQQVDDIQSATISDEVKLRRSGELIYFVSEQILQKANALLEKSQQSQVDEIDTKIDRSFSDFLASLTQQSTSTLFLVKYLQPQIKANYQRETKRSINFFSATEALNELAEDLIESEIFTLAHDENIEVWIESVERHLKLYPEVNTLPVIAKLNDLTLAQAFVAALFGNFKVEQLGNFYEVEQLKLFR
jgi:chromatin segregation and condensation protein Rec8/ScpA/Scc1 (kleisin family)